MKWKSSTRNTAILLKSDNFKKIKLIKILYPSVRLTTVIFDRRIWNTCYSITDTECHVIDIFLNTISETMLRSIQECNKPKDGCSDTIFLLEIITIGSNYEHVGQIINLYLVLSASLIPGNFTIHLYLIYL